MILDHLKEKGYNSFEACFRVKVKRKGIANLFEKLKLIKPKVDYYCVMIRDDENYDILMGNECSSTSISNIKVNGLR